MNNRLSAQRRMWLLQQAKDEELKQELEDSDERDNSRRNESKVRRADARSSSKHRNISN